MAVGKLGLGKLMLRFPAPVTSGFLGTIGRTEPVYLNSFLDRAFHVVQCRTSNLARLFPYVRDWSGRESWNFGLYGAASEAEPEMADLKAIAEAAERYSSAVLDEGEYIIASADELGASAFDWRNLPRLSNAELAMPGQLLHNFEPAGAIRWVQAVRMQDQAIRLLPTVVTHLYPRVWSSERFWIARSIFSKRPRARGAAGKPGLFQSRRPWR